MKASFLTSFIESESLNSVYLFLMSSMLYVTEKFSSLVIIQKLTRTCSR